MLLEGYGVVVKIKNYLCFLCGISESIMSVLISSLQETIVVGIVAALPDVSCLPLPNLNNSELVL